MESTCDKGRMAESMASDLALAAPTTLVTVYNSWGSTTGSFRKNGKSKTVFMGTKFHEKLIFSAFFSRELATNLRS